MKALLLIALFCLTFSAQAANWAILVAGSNTYSNYRHQADIFHAYQVLTRNGIKPENIITFAYDDIANARANPFKGKVFNKPDGKDVYAGVKIDYREKQVTPQMFLDVIQGNADKVDGGRVLTSTAEDNVFIYFADHGAPGLIAFPHKYLYANDFNKALKTMHDKKMYKEMVIYIEACESGSMFEKLLPTDLNIYATTAANGKESSYAYYCYPQEKVNGKHIGSCLGDEYSIHFLENLDQTNPATETLEQQFEAIKTLTKKSHVQKFGDESIAKKNIAEFQGNGSSVNPGEMITEEDQLLKIQSAVDSRDVTLHYLQAQHELYSTEETSTELMQELRSRRRFDTIFNVIGATLNVDMSVYDEEINFDCLRNRIEMYEAVCGKFSDYGLKYVRNVLQTCQQGVDEYKFEQALVDACYNYSL